MSPARPQEDDDGATTIRTGPASGLNSDFVTSSMYIGDSLPEGLRLGEYEILSVIGEGGFGIVYLAYDHFLQRQVALKEYMPSSLAGRSRMSLDVTIKSERHRDTFVAGLKSFINEARLLAQFDHRALVKVYRFWEGNGTAYMVMPYVVGPTLKAALAEMPAPPSQAWLRGQVLDPLMEALTLLHKANCLHRDIAPDNILLTETGPMLLDFGAARKVIGDLNQNLTVVLKPGYAPIEQYGEVEALMQGPWTDVYALGGVVRYAITGKVPVSATTRLVQDTMVPMAQLAAGHYGDAFLQAVDAALAVKPADRPQDMAQFAALLGEGEALAAAAVPLPAGGMAVPGPTTGSGQPCTVWPQPVTQGGQQPAPGATTQAPAAVDARADRPVAPSRTVTMPEAALLPSQPAATVAGAATPPATATAEVADTPAARKGVSLWWGLASLVLMAAALAAWLLFRPAVPGASVAPVPDGAASAPAPVEPAAVEAASPAAPAEPPAATPAATPAEPVVVAPTGAAPAALPTVPRPSVQPKSLTPPVAEAPDTSPPAAVQPARPSPAGGDRATRCSDLLQKASLEPLTPSETSFLKTECK